MSDVCTSCPHAVLDHEATGCITCKCGAVYEAADPEPVSPPVPDLDLDALVGTVAPENEDETGTTVPEPEAESDGPEA